MYSFINCSHIHSGNVVGSKPYQSGRPKCQNYGMSDSAKYPGLCKPYEDYQNAGSEYVNLDFNSINAQQQPQSYFTYKTYNSEYDSEKMVGTSSRTRNNVQTSFANENYNTNSNNEAHSFDNQREKRPTGEAKVANQQQYTNQARYQTSTQQQVSASSSRYQMSPFQQAFIAYQQQHHQPQKRPIDKTNPFQTYRWDLLFKNYL